MVETGPANNNAHVQGQIQAEAAAEAPETALPAPVASNALPPAQAVGEMNRLNQQHALEQIRNTLFAIDEVTYLWSLSDDQLTWSENLHRVVPNIVPGRSETGRAFASLLDHENEQNRYDSVVGSSEVDHLLELGSGGSAALSGGGGHVHRVARLSRHRLAGDDHLDPADLDVQDLVAVGVRV